MATFDGQLFSSFRDPSGFLFRHNGVLYRNVSNYYRDHYEKLMESGLYDYLANEKLMIRHSEESLSLHIPDSFKIIRPELVPFISYPFEWSFSQLKEAALLTLQIQKAALQYGMSLKDSSGYNIQFLEGRPVFIDTLSFESYKEGKPWPAYRQYCQHFLAPLALMALTDIRLNNLLKSYIDGIPLDLASNLLPRRTRFRLGLAMHIHLHGKSQKRYADKKVKTGKISRTQLLALIDSLEKTTKRLAWQPKGTEWANYYDDTNYSNEGMETKTRIVSRFIEEIKPAEVWDLGANDGRFSRLAAQKGIRTIAFDIDPAAVEKNYLQTRRDDTGILPLLMDLTNPSPALGWHNKERLSLIERASPDMVLALALVHHLAIGNNLPFAFIAHFLSSITEWLVIEFVPKEDSQVERLLFSREDIFTDYSKENFETVFSEYFIIKAARDIPNSKRRIYLMQKRQGISYA